MTEDNMMKDICRWKALNIVSDQYFEEDPYKIKTHDNFCVLLIYPRYVDIFILKGDNSIDILKGL
jgi:hypothetical protein